MFSLCHKWDFELNTAQTPPSPRPTPPWGPEVPQGPKATLSNTSTVMSPGPCWATCCSWHWGLCPAAPPSHNGQSPLCCQQQRVQPLLCKGSSCKRSALALHLPGRGSRARRRGHTRMPTVLGQAVTSCCLFPLSPPMGLQACPRPPDHGSLSVSCTHHNCWGLPFLRNTRDVIHNNQWLKITIFCYAVT